MLICTLMPGKGLKSTEVVLFLLTASYISAGLGYQNEERPAPNYPSYRSANGYEVYHRSAESNTECLTPAPGAKATEAAISANGVAPGATPSPTAAANGNGAQPTSGAAGNGGGVAGGNGGGNGEGDNVGGNTPVDINLQSASASKLHALVQHIYAAQARVQLEANEIKKSQGVATSAQKSLEEAANNVRVITAALQTAQQEVAAAAVRAQTAQLQLAAHDQLLFAARQKVDALSSQMVGLQAEDGVVAPKTLVNMPALLAKLKSPLPPTQTPTAIPAVDNPENGVDAKGSDVDKRGLLEYDDYYNEA